MISFMTPTRERPDGFTQFVDSIAETTTDEVEVLAGIDRDDPARDRYPERPFVTYHEVERMPTSHLHEYLAARCRGDVLVMGADDVVIRTKAWDDILRRRIPQDHIYVAWPWDGICGMCTFPMVSRRWYEIVGYFTPIEVQHNFCDSWIGEIGRLIDRVIPLPEVYFEHRHYITGKTAKDSTYTFRGDQTQYQQDEKAFENGEESRSQAAQRLLRTILTDQEKAGRLHSTVEVPDLSS